MRFVADPPSGIHRTKEAVITRVSILTGAERMAKLAPQAPQGPWPELAAPLGYGPTPPHPYDPAGDPVFAPVVPKPAPKPAGDGWRKVTAPKKWTAQKGDILEGVYLGGKAAEGQYGPYTKHFVRPDDGDAVYVSGVTADQLFASAQLGVRVAVVCAGKKPLPNKPGATYDDYELYIQDGV